MKLISIQTLLLLLFALSTNKLMAQKVNIEVKGTVIAVESGEPIEFATVMIGNVQTQQAITGTTTGIDGAFTITIRSA